MGYNDNTTRGGRSGGGERGGRKGGGSFSNARGGRGGGAGPRPKGMEDRTTLLPKALVSELEVKDGSKSFRDPSERSRPMGRKEERKAEREKGKRVPTRPSLHRRDDGDATTTARGGGAKAARAPAAPLTSNLRALAAAAGLAPAPALKKSTGDDSATTTTTKSTKRKRSASTGGGDASTLSSSKLPASTPLSRMLSSSEGRPNKLKKLKGKLSKADDIEEREIAWLEYKLGRKKKGDKAKSKAKEGDIGEDSDGLDDLLDDLDRLEEETLNFGYETSDDDDTMSDEDFDEDEMEEDEVEPEEMLDVDVAEAWGGISESESASSESEEEAVAAKEDVSTPIPAVTDSAPATKYIPPAMRARLAAAAGPSAKKSEELARLEKTAKGLLNRLGESNIEAILGEIESLFRSNARNDVTTTLTSLILSTISSHANLLDSFVVLYATLVAGLYKIVGIEFGASFVQTLVQTLSGHLESSDEAAGKESTNLITLLAELYNFQIISCVLIFDLIRKFLEGSLRDEKEVELLLKVVRSSGSQLRSDDPTSLKDIIQIVHQKVGEMQADAISSRTKFMLETLTNLKNNRIKAAPGGEAAAEATTRMKKFLSGLEKKRHILAHDPLRVSLSDLTSAETKGKWWLVGAAWGGNPLVDRQDEKKNAKAAPLMLVAPADEEDDLMKLARKQGMNTDVRRRVFVVIMGSTDYVDAHDRLLQLGLTDVQQREIVRVLLHCCGNEKLYNPFYTLVLARLLSLHTHKFTLQYCLWDFLRDLGEGEVGGADHVRASKEGGGFSKNRVPERQVRNLARAYAWCVAKEGVTLSIFKPVNFTSLRPASTNFFQLFFANLILSSQTESPLLNQLPASTDECDSNALQQTTMKITGLTSLAEGLLYFLTTSMGGEDPDRLPIVEWGLDTLRESLMMGLDGRMES